MMQFDAHVTPVALTVHDGFPGQTSPALVRRHGELCASDEDVLVVVVVTALAWLDDEVEALVVASVETVADDDVVVAGAAAGSGLAGGAAVWVVLIVGGCGSGVDTMLDVITVELVLLALSAPAVAGWSKSTKAALTATTVVTITAMYRHLRTSTPSPPQDIVCSRPTSGGRTVELPVAKSELNWLRRLRANRATSRPRRRMVTRAA